MAVARMAPPWFRGCRGAFNGGSGSMRGAVQNPGPGGAQARVAMATCWKQLTVALRWESYTVAMGTIALEAVKGAYVIKA